jgi:hypothetical protein
MKKEGRHRGMMPAIMSQPHHSNTIKQAIRRKSMPDFKSSTTGAVPGQNVDQRTSRQRARQAASLVINGFKPSAAEAARAFQVPGAMVVSEIAKMGADDAGAGAVTPAIDMMWDAMTEVERVGFFRRRHDSIWQTLERATAA